MPNFTLSTFVDFVPYAPQDLHTEHFYSPKNKALIGQMIVDLETKGPMRIMGVSKGCDLLHYLFNSGVKFKRKQGPMEIAQNFIPIAPSRDEVKQIGDFYASIGIQKQNSGEYPAPEDLTPYESFKYAIFADDNTDYFVPELPREAFKSHLQEYDKYQRFYKDYMENKFPAQQASIESVKAQVDEALNYYRKYLPEDTQFTLVGDLKNVERKTSYGYGSDDDMPTCRITFSVKEFENYAYLVINAIPLYFLKIPFINSYSTLSIDKFTYLDDVLPSHLPEDDFEDFNQQLDEIVFPVLDKIKYDFARFNKLITDLKTHFHFPENQTYIDEYLSKRQQTHDEIRMNTLAYIEELNQTIELPEDCRFEFYDTKEHILYFPEECIMLVIGSLPSLKILKRSGIEQKFYERVGAYRFFHFLAYESQLAPHIKAPHTFYRDPRKK